MSDGNAVFSGESLWLGGLRRPMRFAMIALTIATVIMGVVLFVGQLFVPGFIGLRDFLNPQTNLPVLITLILAALAILSAALYFSDTRGSIEVEATGPIDIFNLVLSRVSMIAIAAVVCVMFCEVVARYVFVKPTLWANELSLWIAAFVFLFAGLYAMQQRSHIRIYIIYDMFPRWLQKLSDIISVALIWVFTIAMIWGGFNEARDKFFRWETFGTAWDPPIPATVKPALLIIVVMVAIQALSNLIADWNKAPEHHSPMDEIDETEIEMIRRTIKE